MQEDSGPSTIAQDVFSSAVEKISDYFITMAIVEFPFLALPVIKQMFSFIVKRVISKIQGEGKLFISFSFIDKEVEKQMEEYKRAITELRDIVESATIISGERKNEALNKAKEKLRNLIRMSNN